MQILHGRDVPFPPGAPSYVAIGVFDGVHLGHQHMLSELVEWARDRVGRAAVLTFERHPRAVLAPSPPTFITSLQHRLSLFEACNVGVCCVLEFDRSFASMSAEEFLRNVVCEWVGAKGVLLGHDQRFGRGGLGNLDLLRSIAPELGLQVKVADAVRAGGRIVSSTAIRQAILSGDLDGASKMLGRPVSILGTVVHGQHKGRVLGFPTANLDVHHEVQLPEGVYAASVCWQDQELPAVANIGRRPSFSKRGPAYLDRQAMVEVHILDFGKDLYGEDIEVRFHKKLREERPYREERALREQINRDVQAARAYLERLHD